MYMDIDLFPHLCFTCHLSVLYQSVSVCLSIYQSIIFTMTILYRCLVKISVNVTNPFFFLLYHLLMMALHWKSIPTKNLLE